MLVYLSKKIAIPSQNRVKAIAWSKEHGYIACGGEFGLLKILKLDTVDGKVISGLATPRNLSMNQTLEGHQSCVKSVIWNEKFQKLTSSDANGLIIVWMLYKGSWYEEMINNRNKSVVCGMAWTFDGLKICIVYEDGAVIVGSVDGNRLWGKDIKSIKLTCVEWSPDGKLLLFGSMDSQIHVYDLSGNFISKVPLPAINGVFGRLQNSNASAQVIDIKWFNSEASPSLAVAFSNGLIQFMRNECDESPIIVDAMIVITCISWNNNGTILAVTGRNEAETENKRNQVKFYEPTGELLTTIKVPGKEITCCSWEKEGLRLSLAVDSYIFFANIRPDYKWCYFSNTIVVALPLNPLEQSDGPRGTVIFCEIKSNIKHIKSVKNLQKMAASGQYCVFATKREESGFKSSSANSSSLILCNSIGTPIDSINLDIPVFHLTMNSSRVYAASKENLSVWKFKTPSAEFMNRNLSSKPSFDSFRYNSLDSDVRMNADDDEVLRALFISKSDSIKAIAVSEKILIIAQESCLFQVFSATSLVSITKFSIDCRAKFMEINYDSSKVAIIEKTGVLKIYDFDENQNEGTPGKLLDFERKDVWDFKWASDNNDIFAVTEKAKLLIFCNYEADDSVQSYGYICALDDLVVRTALIDAIIIDQTDLTEEGKKIENYVVDFETKPLKETKKLIETSGLSAATKYVEEYSHPKLWRLLADYALELLDLRTAELAFVRCKDYKGIQCTKRLLKLQNDELKRAEVFAYFGNFEEAEKVYLDSDRKDLAIALKKLVGDWLRVVELLENDSVRSNDQEMKNALKCLGDNNVENQKWNEAITYFEQCEAWHEMLECYSIVENYDGLKYILRNVDMDENLLRELGRIFETAGMCEEAVDAYLKCRQTEAAINCCVNLNEWKTAIKLAEEYEIPNIDPILHQYASHLLAREKYLDIVELYRKANRVSDAASMLLKVADEAKQTHKANPAMLKKVYVLIGLLYEERLGTSRSSRRKNVLSSLLKDDHALQSMSTVFKAIDQPWKGAEAYHFYLLAQRQLHDGYVDAAMKTSLHLIDYDDFIDSEDIYCLIALASSVNRNFRLCSKAFIKLESLESITKEKRKEYQNLAVDIFSKNPPKEARNAVKSECRYCETMIEDWCVVCPSCHTKFPLCVASGRPIMDSIQQWTCKRCGHHAYKSELVAFSNCPLCHFTLSNV